MDIQIALSRELFLTYSIRGYRAVLKDANNQDTNRVQTPLNVTFSILKKTEVDLFGNHGSGVYEYGIRDHGCLTPNFILGN